MTGCRTSDRLSSHFCLSTIAWTMPIAIGFMPPLDKGGESGRANALHAIPSPYWCIIHAREENKAIPSLYSLFRSYASSEDLVGTGRVAPLGLVALDGPHPQGLRTRLHLFQPQRVGALA